MCCQDICGKVLLAFAIFSWGVNYMVLAMIGDEHNEMEWLMPTAFFAMFIIWVGSMKAHEWNRKSWWWFWIGMVYFVTIVVAYIVLSWLTLSNDIGTMFVFAIQVACYMVAIFGVSSMASSHIHDRLLYVNSGPDTVFPFLN
jgi:signal transduction histidine kinase